MATLASEGFRLFINRLIPSAADRTAASSHRATIYSKLDDEYGLYRMFQSGSFSHATGVKGFSDVDYFVSLKSNRPQLSSSALTSVKNTLQERFPFTNIRVSRPAVVLEFGRGYETVEVIPAYYQENIGKGVAKFLIPGVVTEWLESAPEAHIQYVNDCNKIPSTGWAKSFVRLVKAWKFYKNVPVSSFYLEMRAAQYIAKQSQVVYSVDLYYFLDELLNHELAAMNDPTGTTGRIVACSSDYNRGIAISKLTRARNRAYNALEAEKADNTALAFYYWDQLFDGHFPAYG